MVCKNNSNAVRTLQCCLRELFSVLLRFFLLQVKREFRVLSALHSISFPVPKPHLYCEDASVIGTEFYIMDHVKVSVCHFALFH